MAGEAPFRFRSQPRSHSLQRSQQWIMSRGLRGRPFAEPSDISRAQTRPAFSSNGSTRPARLGPSGRKPTPVPGVSFRRAFPGFRVGFQHGHRMPDCSAIHATNASDGTGFVTLLMMFVSSRLRLTVQSCGPKLVGASDPDRRRPEATGVVHREYRPFSTLPLRSSGGQLREYAPNRSRRPRVALRATGSVCDLRCSPRTSNRAIPR